MKRPLLIALGVLVPFFAIVAALFALTGAPPPPPAPGPEPPAEARAPDPPPPPPVIALPHDAGLPISDMDHPVPPAPDDPGAHRKHDVLAAIEAVRPLVLECFSDTADRYPAPQEVTLSFTVHASGRLESAEVVG